MNPVYMRLSSEAKDAEGENEADDIICSKHMIVTFTIEVKKIVPWDVKDRNKKLEAFYDDVFVPAVSAIMNISGPLIEIPNYLDEEE